MTVSSADPLSVLGLKGHIMSALLIFIIILLLIALAWNPGKAHHFFLLAAMFCYVTGMLSTEEFLKSIANPGVMTLVLLLVASMALERTDLTSSLSQSLGKQSDKHLRIRLPFISAFLSSILSNTAVVATLISPLQRVKNIAPTKLLLPLSYFSIAGGTLTLIGTSTNLIVNAQVAEMGLPEIRFFDFTPFGLAALLGVFIASIISYKLLPSTWPAKEQDQDYFVEALVPEDSPLVGRSVEDNQLRHLDHFFLAEIVRDGYLISPVRPFHRIRAGDRLLFSGNIEKLDSLANIKGIKLKADEQGYPRDNLEEVMIRPGSIMNGRSLKEVMFRPRFDAVVVAIKRQGECLSGKLGQTKLKVGDILTLATGEDFHSRPNIPRNFFLLSNIEPEKVIKGRDQIITLAGFLAALAYSAFSGDSLIRPLICYLGILFALKILQGNTVRHRFPFPLIGIVLGALVIAAAFVTTGLNNIIAQWAQDSLASYPPFIAIVCVYLLTLITTELITNNAAAAMMVPVALGVAAGLNIDTFPIIMAVAFGASASFMNPFGYQTNLMVYNSGGYKLKHFITNGFITSVCYSICVLTAIYLAM